MLKFLGLASLLFLLSCKKEIEAQGTYSKQSFASQILNKLEINYSRWDDIEFKGSTLQSWRLKNFNFAKTNFTGATIRDSIFDGGSFENCQFKDTYIVDSIFRNCVITKDALKNAILINVKFEECKLL